MACYRFLADAVVLLHLAYVAFVVLGMAAIVLGATFRWRWVRNFWFRAIHLLMIAMVVGESLLGILCPLTEWEDHLRKLAGESQDSGSFVGRWAQRLLFVDVPPSYLLACYCLFGLVVLAALVLVPPRWPWTKKPPI